MKKLFLFIAWSVVVCSKSQATIRTVCNMPYSPGQYTSLSAALSASVNFDTIYVHGSSVNYGNVSITRSNIVIIGAGHNPNKQAPLASAFTFITISTGYNNVQLIGLTMQSLTVSSNYISIRRCKFTDILGGNSSGISVGNMSLGYLLVEGCVFANSAGSNVDISFGGNATSNTIIRNNIFNGTINTNSQTTTPLTFFITNNVFLGSNLFTFSGIYQAAIANNIFYRSSPQISGSFTGTTMNNNISYLCANNNFSAPGTNNLAGINPLFSNFPPAGALFSYSHDYRLAAGSPGLQSGNDGTDRGVYGGYGYRFNMTGEPPMAQISSFIITSPTVIAPGGTLTISVTSKRIQ